MNKLILISLSLFCCFSLLKAQVQNATCSCPDPFTVATFNTLQIFFSDNQDQRLNATVDYFAEPAQQDIDVLCLQELWDPVQRDAVIAALRSTYPYSYYAPKVAQNCTNSCTLEQITPLRECFDRNDCFDISFNTLKCFVDDCRELFEDLDLECQSCFDLRSHDLDILDRFDECTSLDGLFSGNCTYLFDGWSDNLLLSKTPFISTDYLRYDNSPLAQWTALYAQVNTSVWDVPAHVFCTHLSARLPVIDTAPANEDQIQELIQYVRNAAPRTSPIFIVGDFNAGPSVGGLDGTNTENFNRFPSAGYSSVLLGEGETVCTYCGSSNPLAQSTISEDWMIDHIFIDSQSEVCVQDATRFADSNTILTINGEPFPLSDHYGVKGSFCEGDFNLTPPQTFEDVENGNGANYAPRLLVPSLLLFFSWALMNFAN